MGVAYLRGGRLPHPAGGRDSDTGKSHDRDHDQPLPSAAPVDAVCRDAVDEARAAILEVVPADHVGEHLGVVAEDDRVVTHRFVSAAPGYRGWHWAVTVARAPRARVVTIDEIAMLPGTDALVAPAWVPWSQRVEPGDLGVGDVLPTTDDDPRLSPGWSGLDDLAAASDEPGLRPSGWELGIGRRRVLSPEGRDDATSRLARGRHRSGHPDGPLGARVVQHLRVPDADRRSRRAPRSACAPTGCPRPTAAWSP